MLCWSLFSPLFKTSEVDCSFLFIIYETKAMPCKRDRFIDFAVKADSMTMFFFSHRSSIFKLYIKI